MVDAAHPRPEIVLETDRLLLRPMRASDATVQRELWTERDPRVPAHRRIDAEDRPTVEYLAAVVLQYAQAPLPLLTMEHRESGDVLGYCGFIENPDVPDGEPELAFELLRRTWGQGYATEASRAMVDWARTAGYRRLWATVRAWNGASLRVLAKVGFVESGRVDRDEAHCDSLYLTMELAPAAGVPD